MTLEATLSALAASREVSGETLAGRLGLSRAALWKRIEQLRALGIDIEATAGRGYRLAQPLDLLDAAALRARFDADVAWSIESTNAAIAALGAAMHRRILLAEHQSAGRGRRGRAWQSPLAANLYLSIGWRFERGVASLGGLSLAVGVSVAEALQRAGFATVGLKWPNDLVVAGRKLGGFLIEIGGEMHGPSDAVIGLGLNARMPVTAGQAIDQPWIDLASLRDRGWTRTQVATVVIDTILAAAAQFDRDGFEPFRARFDAIDALAGRPIRVHFGDTAVDGVARGIDANGLLCVDAGGEIRRFASGEVSVRARG